MKKSIWSGADIYGQLGVWVLSLTPFIFFFPSAFRKNDFYMLLLLHGLGLMIIGIWQMVSTLINLMFATDDQKPFFRKNVWIGALLAAVFFIWVYSGNFKISVSVEKYYHTYFVSAYFLMVDIAAIRYWKHINRYYKQMKHG